MYKVIINLPNGDTEEVDELFTEWEDASDAGSQWISDYHAGGEVLHLSNPFDYPPVDDDEDIDFEVIEVSE